MPTNLFDVVQQNRNVIEILYLILKKQRAVGNHFYQFYLVPLRLQWTTL